MADRHVEAAVGEAGELGDVADDRFHIRQPLPEELELPWRDVERDDARAETDDFEGEPARTCARVENPVAALDEPLEEAQVDIESRRRCAAFVKAVPLVLAKES